MGASEDFLTWYFDAHIHQSTLLCTAAAAGTVAAAEAAAGTVAAADTVAQRSASGGSGTEAAPGTVAVAGTVEAAADVMAVAGVAAPGTRRGGSWPGVCVCICVLCRGCVRVRVPCVCVCAGITKVQIAQVTCAPPLALRRATHLALAKRVAPHSPVCVREGHTHTAEQSATVAAGGIDGGRGGAGCYAAFAISSHCCPEARPTTRTQDLPAGDVQPWGQ